MIDKREGQATPASQEQKTSNFFDKYKIPIIILLSVLAVGIITTIVIVLTLPKNHQASNDQTQPNSSNATAVDLTEDQKKVEKSVMAVLNSENPEETADEHIPQLQEKINNPETSTEDKVMAVSSLTNIYTHVDKYLEAITLLRDTLKDPYLDSAQELQLLYKLDSIFYFTKNLEDEAEVIDQILNIPVDDSYPADEKAIIDKHYSKKLEKIKNQEGESNE